MLCRSNILLTTDIFIYAAKGSKEGRVTRYVEGQCLQGKTMGTNGEPKASKERAEV
jgi:hypothetical protein